MARPRCVERAAVPPLDDRAVDAALAPLLGEQQQVPPMLLGAQARGRAAVRAGASRRNRRARARRSSFIASSASGSAANELRVRRLLLPGTYVRTLVARPRRGAGLRRSCRAPAPAVGRSVRRAAHVHAGAARTALQPASSRRRACCRPTEPSWTCRGCELATPGGRAIAAGTGRSRRCSRRRPGELRAYDGRAASSAWCRVRRTGGCGRRACSSTSRRRQCPVACVQGPVDNAAKADISPG